MCAVGALGAGVPAALFGLPAVNAATPKDVQKVVVAPDAKAAAKATPKRRSPAAGGSTDVHHAIAAHARRVAKTTRRKAQRVRVPAALQSIAQCESGANPKSVSSDGTYRGKYQFSRETWAAMGGRGDPAAAPEAEQDKRAIALYNSSGPGQWPVCGQ